MNKDQKQYVLSFISGSSGPVSRKELFKAFKIKGTERKEFTKVLDELESENLLIKKSGRYSLSNSLPHITTLEILDIGSAPPIKAAPTTWDVTTQGPLPYIEVKALPQHTTAHAGDRLLARLSKNSDGSYVATAIKMLNRPQNRIIGLIETVKGKYILRPTDKKIKYDYEILEKDLKGAKAGDLAEVELQPSRQKYNKKARVLKVVGKDHDPKAFSQIAIREAGLRTEFSEAIIEETLSLKVPELGKRTDIRNVPVVTIDGPDARDFDDAVWAEETAQGFNIIVAIADVSFYVRPGQEIDREAYLRGNSTYFPDCVNPMLPEAISNDLCSLVPNQDRACLLAKLRIDRSGHLKEFHFDRGLMRSAARLTYEQVQAAKDGAPDEITRPLMDMIINPLYAAYDVLARAREKRGALDLDLPETKVLLNSENEMIGITQSVRLDSHRLIEEFMILANVAAAMAMEEKSARLPYRDHERPDAIRMESAKTFIRAFGIPLPEGPITTSKQINQILKQAAPHEYAHLISETILRSQSQAHYSPENKGHFGLALERYGHFTSPIRRYSDLLLHRGLVSALNLGPGGLSQDQEAQLEEMCAHISATERTSAMAERKAIDRFAASYLSEHIGDQFEGRIRSVTRFGLFVSLDNTGADGLVPRSSLPNDHYIHDEDQNALIGKRSGRVYRLGARISVELKEADPLTGSTVLSVIGDGGADIAGYEINIGPKSSKRRSRHKYHEKTNSPDKKSYKGRKRKPSRGRSNHKNQK